MITKASRIKELGLNEPTRKIVYKLARTVGDLLEYDYDYIISLNSKMDVAYLFRVMHQHGFKFAGEPDTLTDETKSDDITTPVFQDRIKLSDINFFSDVTLLAQQNSLLNQKNELLEDEIEMLYARIDSLKSQNQNQVTLNELLKQEIEKLSCRIDDLVSRNLKLVRGRWYLKKRIMELMARIGLYEKQIEELEQRKLEIENRNNSNNAVNSSDEQIKLFRSKDYYKSKPKKKNN